MRLLLAALVNKLVPWCAWLLSSALEILRLRLRLRLLQFVFKMSAFGFNTSLKACTPLAKASIDDQLIKLLSGMNDSLTQFFNVSDLCPVNFILHYPPNLVINRI